MERGSFSPSAWSVSRKARHRGALVAGVDRAVTVRSMNRGVYWRGAVLARYRLGAALTVLGLGVGEWQGRLAATPDRHLSDISDVFYSSLAI